MTHATLVRKDRWAGAGPDFNRQAAETIYKALVALPDGESQMFGALLLDGCNHHELMSHYVEYAEAQAAEASERAATLRKAYSREAVAKERRGEDNTHELACLVEIGKAFPFSFGQRSQYSRQSAKGRSRDAMGRFSTEHREIHTYAREPHDKDTAKALGIPEAGHLSGATESHYQQAYQQVDQMLHSYRNPNLGALLHLQVDHGNGETTEHVLPVENGKTPKISAPLVDGSRIRSAAVSVQPQVTAEGAVMAGMHGLGFSGPATIGTSGTVGRATDISPQGAMGRYVAAASKPYGDNEPYSAASRGFGHMQRGAQLLQDSLGDAAPPKLAYALAVANHVGQFGPEAQKVIGPIADRTAYRYRGTERAPSRALRDAFQSLHADPTLRGQAARRRAAVYGTEPRGSLVTRTESGAIRGTDPDRTLGWQPGPVLDYFHDHLPNADLNELQRKSGVIPPSEGVIINRSGEVMHQAVGYADDWYLPFNLKHLAALKGGEYIRTRSFGGPTTEDIYTGLVSGARNITVVSHNGVYNIEFERNFRGGRRLNDKAARMVGRYGHLLDALRSGQVQRGGISASRQTEIRNQLARDIGSRPGTPAYDAALKQRLADETTNPVMSQEEKNTAARAWIEDVAGRRTDSAKGYQTGEELENDVVDIVARRRMTADGLRPSMQAQAIDLYRRNVAPEILVAGNAEATAHNIAETLGGRSPEDLDRWMARAQRTTYDRVHPLALNGKGYDDALHALQEQFPYYIERVSYQPWGDAIGQEENTHRSAKDTGYVRPRHLRPAEAQSGYFDTNVYGANAPGSTSGKVRADTTRYQNIRVYRGKPRPASGGVTGAAKTSAASATPAAPEAAAAQRAGADFDLLNALRDQTKMAGTAEVTVNGTPVDLSNKGIKEMIDNSRFPSGAEYAAFKEFYSTPKRELEAQLADPKTADKVRGLMDQVLVLAEKDKPLVKVPASVASSYRNKGAPSAAKTVPETPMGRLAEIDDEHDFPGSDAAFHESSKPTVDYVKRTFDADPLVSPLVDSGRLAEIDAPDSEWEEKLGSLTSSLHNEIRNSNRGGMAFNRESYDRTNSESLGLLRATQLRRRHKAASGRVPAPAAAPAAPEVIQETHYHFPPGSVTDPGYVNDVGSQLNALGHRPPGT